MSRLGAERKFFLPFPPTVITKKMSLARVNAKTLSQYRGQTVRLTAKVVKLSGEIATVQASDGGEVGNLCRGEANGRLVYTFHGYQ